MGGITLSIQANLQGNLKGVLMVGLRPSSGCWPNAIPRRPTQDKFDFLYLLARAVFQHIIADALWMAALDFVTFYASEKHFIASKIKLNEEENGPLH